MPVGERILNGVVGRAYPFSVLVLDVAEAGFVKIDLADVVKQSRNGNALVAVFDSVKLFYTRAVQNINKAIVDVEAVLEQATLTSQVIARAGGGCEKVALDQKVKQLVGALSCDLFLEYLHKTFLICHGNVLSCDESTIL